MAITITTLNNEAAAAKTFVEIGKDLQNSSWVDTSDESSTLATSMVIKQSIIGKRVGTNIPIRRTLVQCKISALEGGTSTGDASPDDFTVNVTMTGPVLLTSLTATNQNDALAFIRNFLTAANQAKLLRGEV